MNDWHCLLKLHDAYVMVCVCFYLPGAASRNKKVRTHGDWMEQGQDEMGNALFDLFEVSQNITNHCMRLLRCALFGTMWSYHVAVLPLLNCCWFRTSL